MSPKEQKSFLRVDPSVQGRWAEALEYVMLDCGLEPMAA